MNKFTKSLMLFLITVSYNVQADYCIAVSGGWGKGGTTFVGTGFTVPAKGLCKPWSGILKTATSVVGTSVGTACLSDDGKLFTVSLQSTAPEFFGIGVISTDHIELCPLNSTQGCPAHAGQFDRGSFFSGPAAKKACSAADSLIPSSHD